MAPGHPQSRPQRNAQRNQNRQGPKTPQSGRSNQRPRIREKPKPQFPAYVQRDLLLIPKADTIQGIEEVRMKFDPLAKKIPAHVTLLFPEHELIVGKEFLKTFEQAELPNLESLVFSAVTVHEDMYLWLMPDAESSEKIKNWHTAFVAKLETHTLEENYQPHITLGYVPRSQTAEQAIEFAKNLIKLPVKLEFEKIILEEFSENQNSSIVDSVEVGSKIEIEALPSL